MRAAQPFAAVAQMHAHGGAGVVGILTFDRAINKLMLVEHVAQSFDLIELRDLR
jgi:hypothetical protein